MIRKIYFFARSLTERACPKGLCYGTAGRLCRMVLGAAAVIIMTGGIGAGMACAAGVRNEAAAGDIRAGRLRSAQDTDQMVVVVGQGGSKVRVSYHVKGGDGNWEERFCVDGVYGKNGAAWDKKEGDGKTPLGTYHFTMAFGLKDDPGSTLAYHKLTSADYWVDDPNSSHYNRMVDSRTTKRDWKSAEKMAASSPYYNYGLALDYNPDCVPGKGSAIFLHCTGSAADTGSAGCVRIPEEQMKELVRSVDEETKIVIAADAGRLEYVD